MKIKFVEIEKGEIQENHELTYDIEVKEDHSYNINGTIVHNSACLTGPNTGFGSRGWQLSAVEQCSNAANNIKIIADGGIRKDGDIAKAIAFGADMVMVGGMFAAHDESPGVIEIVDGEPHKVFYGSASARQKGNNHHVEGKSEMLPLRGSIFDTLIRLEENLKSSVSYAGGTKLFDLYNSKYVLLHNS